MKLFYTSVGSKCIAALINLQTSSYKIHLRFIMVDILFGRQFQNGYWTCSSKLRVKKLTHYIFTLKFNQEI